MKPNPEYIKELQTIVGEAPFPRHMAMTLTEMDAGLVNVDLKLDRFCSYALSGVAVNQ